jgi:pimeloyl-ACP methyl ester carboxylesterase
METGTAAGVPYVLEPPVTPRPDAPVVVAWHLFDPPRTETAMAAALPLAGLDAWRLYLGLPLTGVRTPKGGMEALGLQDVVLKVFAPVVDQAAAELPAVLGALGDRLGAGPLALLGGSAGSLVAQQVATERPVAALALVSPVAQLRPVIEANGRAYGFTYPWSAGSDAVAARLDFVARAGELTAPTLLVVGAEDDAEGVREPAARLHAALPGSRLETIPGLRHALAEEPGTDAAPQTPHAATVDHLVTTWFSRHLPT